MSNKRENGLGIRRGGQLQTKERKKPLNTEVTDGIPVDVWNARRREQEKADLEELKKLRQEYNEFEKRSRG